MSIIVMAIAILNFPVLSFPRLFCADLLLIQSATNRSPTKPSIKHDQKSFVITKLRIAKRIMKIPMALTVERRMLDCLSHHFLLFLLFAPKFAFLLLKSIQITF
jgi:hypothetical protein